MTTRRLTGVLLVSAAACLPIAHEGVSAGAVARGTSTIIGYLWTADSAPIPNATLRLRNIATGLVELTASSDENGEFTFSDAEGGAYVIEYVDRSGNVLAVGSRFSVAAGETIATFVRLGSRRPFAGGFFTNAAAVVVSSAASIGVTAVAPTGRPVSPNQ
ncbi:MAG: carboxypeptidase-like regulatory domain-containing protein [Vicinamibacterales bacterium]